MSFFPSGIDDEHLFADIWKGINSAVLPTPRTLLLLTLSTLSVDAGLSYLVQYHPAILFTSIVYNYCLAHRLEALLGSVERCSWIQEIATYIYVELLFTANAITYLTSSVNLRRRNLGKSTQGVPLRPLAFPSSLFSCTHKGLSHSRPSELSSFLNQSSISKYAGWRNKCLLL